MIDLERLLKDLGINQSQLARLVNRSDQAITNVKKGKMQFPPEWKLIIKKKFQVDVDQYQINMAFEPKSEYRSELPTIIQDPHGKQIPAFEGQAFATISPAMGDVVALVPDTFVRIPMFSQGEYAVQVTGNSMKPYISHGDWIIIKRITNQAAIIYGEPYMVITKSDNLKTVKFVKQGEEPETLWLVPYNTEQFEPQEIEKKEILEMYRVLGLLRVT